MAEKYERRVALIALRDKLGKVLLQHRDNGAPTYPNSWAFFGGRIEEGESPEEAVRREAKEELGIELNNLKFFKRFESALKEREIVEEFIFTAPLDYSLEQLRKQQQEGDNLGLFSFGDLDRINLNENAKSILKELFTA